MSTAKKGYQAFVNSYIHREYDSPLDSVVSSTLLGSPAFIEFIKDKYLSGKNLDKELPALKELTPKASINDIFAKVEAAFRKDKAFSRNAKIYFCQRYTGEKLKDIGIHFGIGESGVSQVCRRVAQRIEKDEKLKRKMNRIARGLNMSRMKT